jgi:hypothetical protein
MIAHFEYADGDQHNVTFPSRPRGIYKRNEEGREIPYRVTFINRPLVCDKEEEKWIWFCQQCVHPYKKTAETILADDMSESPVSQETQQDIANLMTEKAKTDKVSTGLTLIPFHSLFALGKIFVEGLRYGKDNWKKGVGDKEYQEERLEHALTHLSLWKEGDRSEAHLAKVAWFCFTQLELERLETIQSLDTAIPQEIEYEQYKAALTQHFKTFVRSFHHGPNNITIQFASRDDLVLDYDKDRAQVAALPDIKLYTPKAPITRSAQAE